MTGGTVDGPDVEVTGAGIDSRTIQPGQLFVPVTGVRDGHDFVAAAVSAGAPAYLTTRQPVGTGTAVVVDDTERALRELAIVARARVRYTVGVTGSVGKTSTKDLLARCLAARWSTGASVGSFNNELGVPLTLLDAPDDADVVVVEMGARAPGHIAWLCDIATPTVAVVTTVAGVHLETFGTIERVAAAKGELVQALPDDGTAVLNADDQRVAAMRRLARGRVLTYSATGDAAADLCADGVEVDASLQPRFTLRSPWGERPVRLGVRGAHNVVNALAAAGAALALDVPLDAVCEQLAAATLSRWRMELWRSASGAQVLNDSYNANPTSMAAALRALVQLPARRHVAVLGRMAELGEGSAEAHREIGELARSLGVVVVAVGEPAYGADTVDVPDDALAALARLGLGPDDAVLVKGSRSAGLEVVAQQLAGDSDR